MRLTLTAYGLTVIELRILEPDDDVVTDGPEAVPLDMLDGPAMHGPTGQAEQTFGLVNTEDPALGYREHY